MALAVIVGTQLVIQLLLQAPPVRMDNNTATYFTSQALDTPTVWLQLLP